MEAPGKNPNAITAIAMLAATTMIAQQIAGKAARDAFFLTYFEVTRLPLMVVVSAGFSIAAVLLMSRLLVRYGPARLVPVVFAISAVLLLLQWWVIGSNPRAAAAMLYIQVAAINSVLISGFWSVINERFDPFSAKAMIARLAAAATLGGLAGGLLANAVASIADANAILLMLSLMHAVCGIAVLYIGRGTRAVNTAGSVPVATLFAPLKESSLLRRMAVLVLLVATTAAILDYILKAEAAAALSPDELISFFSYFYVGVGLFGFLLQSSVGDKALKWFGLGGTMLVWPLAILTTGLGVLVLRSLATATLLRASANVFYNSFFRTGFEQLYTPIPAAHKRTGKVMIDVGAERSGDMLGALIVMGILLLPVFSDTALIVAALALALLCLVVILVLHRNYVSQLADNLRSGRIDDSAAVGDLTESSKSMVPAQGGIRRAELLREVELHRARQAAAPATGEVAAAEEDVLLGSISALRSGDEARIRRVLVSREMTPELVTHAVALLDDERVLPEVLRALRGVATSSAGQLVDALLDPFQSERIRRRLPVVLGYSGSPLAIAGLVSALDDASWNVRFRAARGLQMIRRRDRHAAIPVAALLDAVDRELQVFGRRRRGVAAGTGDAVTALQRLEMIFFLLGATDDPETIELCWHAMHVDDMRLKGTALEYLENRLSPEIWARLHPVLDAEAARQREPSRSGRETADELRAAAGRLLAQAPPVPPDALARVLADGDNAVTYPK